MTKTLANYTYASSSIFVSLIGRAIFVLPIPVVSLGRFIVQNSPAVGLNGIPISVQPHPTGIEVHAVVPPLRRDNRGPPIGKEQRVYLRRLVQELVDHRRRPSGPPPLPRAGVPLASGGRQPEILLLELFQFSSSRDVARMNIDAPLVLVMGDDGVEMDQQHESDEAPNREHEIASASCIATESR